ncbi:carbohydrate esterase [Meristemomyces frigidus]|nr:carbohydrate esterase [Meristemomyces frigidus]
MFAQTAILALVAGAFAAPVELAERATCPTIHIFGARETTASPGYGSSSIVVNEVLNAYPGSTAEAITYPACGGQASCGSISYSSSVATGATAVYNAVSAFAAKCPSTKLVLVGYSQGSEIFDDSLCGGSDQGTSSFKSIASFNIKAVIFQGDPRFIAGAPYNVGTCKAGGFSARPAGSSCGSYNSLIQSYCDAADPYCCNGNNAATHQGYGAEYGAAALTFVKSKLG